jgi:hypothetical protein
MSWNNTKGFANWAGGGSATSNNYILPSISSVNISATNISTSNLTAYNGYISYISNITTQTNAVILNPGTILTAFDGTLYVNGEPISAPSSFSTIADWSKFPALTNVNMNFSSISSVLNIECSNQITTKTLIGTEGVAAVAIQGVNVSGVNGYFPTMSTNTFRNNGTMQNVGSLANIGPVTMNETLNVGLDITCDTIVRVPQVDTSYANVFKELRVAPIFPVGPTIGSIINMSTITGDTIIARKAISTNLISSGVGYFSSIYVGHIDIGSNIIVPDIVCSNITVVDTATIYDLTNTNGANFQGGASIENVLNMNANINFPYNSTSDPLVLPPNTQPLYDMSYIRDITCGSVYVQGGWNGNTVIPPYHINSLVTIGNDGGITSPGVVVINGQNPGIPGENITNALTVRGDMAVDFGILTTYNGLVCEPFNIDANAIEVNGISALNGATNVVGSFSVEGSAGILGNTTITGAVEITGGTLITGGLAQLGGDFTLGNSGTPYHGVINTPLALNNELNMGNNIIQNVSILTATEVIAENISASNITLLSTLRTFKAENISTNSLVMYGIAPDNPGGILFNNLSSGFGGFIGLGGDDPYPLNMVSLKSLALTALDGSLVTSATQEIESSAGNNHTITGSNNATLQAGNNVTVVSLDATATLHAYDTVSILSDTAGIGLNAQTGVFMNDNAGAILNVALSNIDGSTTTGDINLTSGSNINLSATNQINCLTQTTANDLLVNTIRNSALDNIDMQTTGNMYLGTLISNVGAYDAYLRANRNIAIFGGNKNGGGTNYDGSIKILTGSDIEMRTYNGGAIYIDNTTPPFDVVDSNRNIYITAGFYLNLKAGTGYDILLNSRLNLSTNSIIGVNGISSIFVSTNTLKANNISTNSLFVSSINAKQYPYTSTLNAPPSTFSYAASNTQSRTVPYVLYSNVAFPNAGWFNVSQKAIFTRASGTSDTHQSVLYTPGAFISTPSIKDGYASLPYTNQNNNSTFTTLTTELYISSTQLNRNIILYNDTNNNFVGNLFMDRLVATYNPSRGINPE